MTIIVNNNVFSVTLHNPDAIKWISEKKSTVETSENNTTYNVTFDQTDAHLFNALVDNSDITINDLTLAINAAHSYFTNYTISIKMLNIIERYIISISKYGHIWTSITSKPDYNLCLFRHRTLPYFNLESKDWVKANMDAMKKDYPSEIIGNALSHMDKQDFMDEMGMITQNNNFLTWSLLSHDKYPDILKQILLIETLCKLDLHKYALMLFFKLMISPVNCHIVREVSVWSLLNRYFENKHIEELMRYCMYYSFYILRQEETIMFSQVPANSRVLFTLNQAANIPAFNHAHLDRNPHIQQLTDNTRLSDSMLFYLRGVRKINDSAEFQRRFHLATAGAFKGVDMRKLGAAITGSILIPCVQTSPLEKGFEDVDWNRERSFSVPYPYMTDNPTTSEDMAFLNFLEYYYPSYVSLTDEDFKAQVLKPPQETVKPKITPDDEYEEDIPAERYDALCIKDLTERAQNIRLTTSASFVDGVLNTVFDDVPTASNKKDKDNEKKKDSKKDKNNEKKKDSKKKKGNKSKSKTKKNDKNNKKKTKKKSKKHTDDEDGLSMSEGEEPSDHEDEEPSDHEDEEPSKHEEVKESAETKEISKTDVTSVKIPLGADKSRPKIEYNQLADIDVSITTRDHETFKLHALALYSAIKNNCEHRGPVYINEIKTIASIKYKIYGPGISRPIDIFRIPYDPAKMVKKFHVHAVKMYYDNDVTLFRSCVSCLLSGVGESYKWFSCNKIPADVLLKYAQRGFSIILNARERDAMSNYIEGTDRWGHMLKYLNITSDKIYCCITAMHPFFRPGLYNSGIRMTLRNFERDPDTQYPNALVISHAPDEFPFGSLPIKSTNKIYPPNMSMVNTVLDFVESE